MGGLGEGSKGAAAGAAVTTEFRAIRTWSQAIKLPVPHLLAAAGLASKQAGSGSAAAAAAAAAQSLHLGLCPCDVPGLLESVAEVVLAGGESEQQAQRREIPLLKALHSVGVRTVAVELYETPVSLVPLWSTAADATVDCVNRATGWLALIVALRGESGNLGLKTGAITPPLEPLVKPTPTPLPSPTPEP
jgi:hypothetical protein